jgi:hypothetical protein
MKSLILVVCAATVLLFPVRSVAQTHVDSPRVTMSILDPLVVGTTTLKPGEYRFQCRMFDGKTYLVVTSVESRQEVLRVRCEEETLAAKVNESNLRTATRPDGSRLLQSVRIKGEMVAHRLVE